MKPLNLDNRPCSPISSNCVVWQGPTLTCINLCTGDTISDVVAKMAEELCILLDQTNINNYDLTCLGITACGPKDFQALIQLLIDKICELNNLPTDNTRTETTCPDCPVTVATCLRETDTNLPATMQLLDYVQMLANKICSLIDQIGDLQVQVDNLDIRVTALENAVPPSFTLPSIIVDCTLSEGTIIGGNSYTIDLILNALINNDIYGYCELLGATGLPAELSSAVASACITSSTPTLSNPPVPFGTEYFGSWVSSPTTVADTITNLWISICDIYDAVSNISLTVQDTNTIDLELTSGVLTANIQDTGWFPLLGFDFMGDNAPECRRIGNQIHFRGTAIVPLADPVNPAVVATWTSTAYNAIMSAQTFSVGVNGCVINSNGSITFNNGSSVIPPQVLDTLTNLDASYSKGYVIGVRQINLNPASFGTALTGVFTLGVFNDKRLYISVLKDLEYTSSVQNILQLGSSHLRYITSNVRSGEQVPNFISTNTNIHNDPTSGTQPLNVQFNSFEYPFDCDAGEETQIGGFGFRLDGLIAYLDPCTTDIKTYICK